MDQDQKLTQVVEVLKTLAHYHRLRIVILLSEQGSLNVSAIAAQLSLDQALTSHHLTKMRDKGILVRLRRGKEIYYSLSDPTLVSIPILLLNRLAK